MIGIEKGIEAFFVVAFGVVLFSVGSLARGQVKAVLDLEKAPEKGETLVWSPLFQASWDKLNEINGGAPEKVDPPNPLIAKLDGFQWNEREVMPDGGYAVFSGPATAAFAEATAKEIKEKFGWEMRPRHRAEVPGGVSLYGVLIRDLSFEKEFFRSKKKVLVFKGGEGGTHQAKFFGTAGELSGRYRDAVKVLAYDAQKAAFSLRIATKKPKESLIIYKPSTALSFQKGIEAVKEALKRPLDGPYGSLTDGGLHDFDIVKIPYLKLEAETEFGDQLKGARSYRGNNESREIVSAYQITKFELFEKGARVRVETGLDDGSFGSPPEKVKYIRRRFECDGPFFVFAWKDDAAWPYFAAWIDGKGALQLNR